MIDSSEKLLDTAAVDGLEADGLLCLVQAIGSQQSRLEAARMAAIERFARLTADDEWAQDLLAAESRISVARAGDDLALAHTLATRLPKTRAALSLGLLDAARVRQIERATAVLDDEQAREVEHRIFPDALEANPRLLYQRTRAAVLAVDPEGAARRAALRREQRRVSMEHEHDGMSWLNTLLPTEDAQAVYSLVDSLAREANSTGEDRTMDQLRADALRDLLLGRHRARVVTHVYVTARASTLFGLDEQPGELRGLGAIPADQVRRMAYQFGATWRGLTVDGDDTVGKHCRLAEKRYKPSDTLTELIHLRDRTCRFPACGQAAQRCDIDHHIPYQRGGSTCPCNCDSLCRRHHRLKHSGTWTVEHGADGELTWTAPTGSRHSSVPEPVTPATHQPRTPAAGSDPPPF